MGNLLRILVLLVMAVVGIGVGAGMGAGSAAEPVPPPGPKLGAAEAITATAALARAEAARMEVARLEKAWADESERLDVVLATLVEETARLRQRQQALAAEHTALTQRLQQRPDHAAAAVVAAQTEQAAVRARLTEAVLQLNRRLPPGSQLPPPENTGNLRVWSALLQEDEDVRRVRSAVQVITLEGRELAVRLLVAGPLSWWMTLDGEAVGCLWWRDGEAVVKQYPAHRQAIAQALAIADGLRPPEVLMLPLPPELVEVGP